MRRYKVTFLSDFIPSDTVLMDAATLNGYTSYLASPRHAELRQQLNDPGPDQFHIETVEVPDLTYENVLSPEQLLERRG